PREHRPVHRRLDPGPVRAGHGAGPLLPQEVPAVGLPALAAAAAVAAADDRLRRRVALDPRAGQRRPEPLPRRCRPHLRTDPVAGQLRHRAAGGDRREHLTGDPLQRGAAVQRAAVHPGRALRGRAAGRRHRRAVVPAHHPAAAAPGGLRGAAARGDLHDQGPRPHHRTDRRRPRQRHPDARHPQLRDELHRVRLRSGRRAEQHPDPDRPGLQPRLPARERPRREERMTAMSTITTVAPAAPAPSAARRRRPARTWLHTAIGVVLVAIMLFPVYWMVNASLAPAGSSLTTQWLPLEPDFSGYSRALADQGQNLVTSLIVAIGACVLSVAIAAPCAYALAQFRIRGTAVLLFFVLISQMIPGIVIANALYTVYTPLGMINSIPGLILADASQGIPFAI